MNTNVARNVAPLPRVARESRTSMSIEQDRPSILELAAPLGVPIMALAIIGFFTFATDGFLIAGNFENIFANAALPIIVAVGLTFPLLAGEFDLSIAAIAGFGTIVYAQLVAKENFNAAFAIAITLAASAGAGVFNGLMVAYVGLPALVATIAMSSILIGLQFYISGSVQIFGGYPESLVHFARSNIGPIPTLVVVAAMIVVALWLLLERTIFGRHVKAVGGNREAARLAGVDVRRTLLLGYMISALTAGVAGVLFANKQAVAYPLSGLDVLLPSYTAAFIGAATFRFGEFNIFGTVVGVLINMITANGLILLGVPNYTTYIFQGVILLVALIFARVVALKRIG